jgi:hypothetical protein
VTAAVVRLRRLLPHPTLRRLLPHQTLAAELRCTSGEVQNRKAKNQRVQARAFSPARAAAARPAGEAAPATAWSSPSVGWPSRSGDRGLYQPPARAHRSWGPRRRRPSRFRRVGSYSISAKPRKGSHQEDAVELGKFARCFPTT